jgi:hypothetical protein
MEEKTKKAQEIHALMADLNQQIVEAAKMGLTVEIRPDYSHPRREPRAYLCNVGEYISYP